MEIIILMVVFSLPIYWLKRRYDFKEKQITGGRGDADPKLLKAYQEERAVLLERIENLETIVCQSDYELNMRIAQLVAGASKAGMIGPGEPGEPDEDEGAPAQVGSKDDADGADDAEGGVDSSSLTLTAGDNDAEAVRAAVAAPAALAEGQVLAKRYRVERLLGRGGMGAVYLAHDEALNEQVALKVISAAWYHDQQTLIARFRREVAAARKVSSPNVIRIHDLGEAPGGLLYISMEYFEGQTLSEVVTARGPLGKRDLRDIIGQVCDGLGAAHRADVVHRDLKPQNVLVGERNAVKIIDFGLAKSGIMSGVTATGLLLGTPHYMSPEQVRGKDVDSRTDIYALGALAYYAVTGRPPFDGDNPIAVSFAHLSETPLAPRQLNPNVSRDLERAILEALAKDPSERPPDAASFKHAL
ncbi:serine/threonine-protein kinase [Haliangium sp.]|uniref:serine/threonine-protein kinase n=1 Tax=Haliangium sp. TaxID=2663208 RepID=UPI003D0CB2B5